MSVSIAFVINETNAVTQKSTVTVYESYADLIEVYPEFEPEHVLTRMTVVQRGNFIITCTPCRFYPMGCGEVNQ